MSEALCVTALGPAALCDAVLDAVGRLFDAEWASLVLTSGDLPSSIPSQVTWYREPAQRLGAPRRRTWPRSPPGSRIRRK